MRAVVQRVTESSVSVGGEIKGEIGKGLTVLLGVAEGDTEKDADFLAEKILGLRIFEDEDGKMNLSVGDLQRNGIQTGVLCISQFTLLGDCRKGKRPSFAAAAAPEEANRLYEYFMEKLRALREPGTVIAAGVFRADMMVKIYNDGPVTMLLDSSKLF